MTDAIHAIQTFPRQETPIARGPVTQELHAFIGRRSTAASQNLEIVVAYEDIHAARRAKEVCDRLGCRFGGALTFELHLWRFDVLRNPQLRETAVKDAARADWIFFATGGGSLPHYVETWIELWRYQRRASPGALILLLNPLQELDRIRNAPLYAYLKMAAQHARMEFFVSGSDRPGTQPIRRIRRPLNGRPSRRLFCHNHEDIQVLPNPGGGAFR